LLLDGRLRLAASRIAPGYRSTFVGWVFVANIHSFCFPLYGQLAATRRIMCPKFHSFSVALADLVAAYSEIAPLGLCTLLLGVIFVRRDSFRAKRLMLMSAILLIVLINPYYLRNLIGFLFRSAEQRRIAQSLSGTPFSQCLP
jgi:hypothetical protein